MADQTYLAWLKELDPRDLRVETISNESGASVTITHLPTGTSTKSGWQKSHFKARDEALRLLQDKLAKK